MSTSCKPTDVVCNFYFCGFNADKAIVYVSQPINVNSEADKNETYGDVIHKIFAMTVDSELKFTTIAKPGYIFKTLKIYLLNGQTDYAHPNNDAIVNFSSKSYYVVNEQEKENSHEWEFTFYTNSFVEWYQNLPEHPNDKIPILGFSIDFS